MTYQGQPGSAANSVLKVLVVLAIIWVAYWAATGGFDEITTPEPSSTTETTVSE